MYENILQNNERELLLALRRGDLSSERDKEHWSDEERENLRVNFAARSPVARKKKSSVTEFEIRFHGREVR